MAISARRSTAHSRGCRTCRARKVKCDETRPYCQRCALAHKDCQGYREQTPLLIEAPQPAELSLSSEPRALPYPDEPKHIACLVSGMVIGNPSDGGFSFIGHGLRTSEDQNYLLYTSSRCLARVFYGRQFKLRQTITEGLAKYGSMLQVLRKQIANPTSARTVDLIQVIVMCILLESIIAYTTGDTNFSAAHSHISGLAELLRVRGPKAFEQRSDILPFEVTRCYIIGRAVQMRIPTFLAEPQWKTIPWKFQDKDPFSECCDNLADVPSLLHDLERLRLSSIKWPRINEFYWPVLEVQGTIVNPKHNLPLKLKALLQNLFRWRWKWDHYCSSNVTVSPTDPNNTVVTDHQGNPQFQTYLLYSDLAIREIIFYQAALVLALRIANLVLDNDILESVDKTPPPEVAQPLPFTPLLRPTDINSFDDARLEFYRSMEGHICGLDGKPAAEFYQLMFPCVLVAHGIVGDSIENSWMARIREKMLGNNGHKMWSAGGDGSTPGASVASSNG